MSNFGPPTKDPGRRDGPRRPTGTHGPGPGERGRSDRRGPSDRHGPPDKRGGRGSDRPASGRAGAEGAILGVLHELERPLTLGDFAVQKGHFAKILSNVKQLRIKSLDEVEFDCRTRLFTALLRAGRQAAAAVPAEETPEAKAAREVKELQRKELMNLLGEIWRAAGDEARAGKLLAESGNTVPALKLLAASGEWQQVAELHRRQGRHLEAAKVFSEHEDWANALVAFREVKDLKSWLHAAIKAGDSVEALKAAKALPPRTARELLLKANQGDLFMQMLVEKGDWGEVAQLYERAEQWADAAQAFEKAHRLSRAAEAYSKADDLISAARCLDREVKDRLAKNDAMGAGEVLRRAGQVERAVDVIGQKKPLLAFQWLQEAGLDEKALEFAKMRAKELEAKPAEAAQWLERAGELPTAAIAFMDARAPAEAMRVWESLQDWERAGDAAAMAGQLDHAVDLFRRAGILHPEERAQELAPKPPEPPTQPPPETPVSG